MSERILANDLLEFIIMCKRVRPRSDDRHIAKQHIEELRQFVNAGFTQPFADGGDARITLRGLYDAFAIFENAHGPEFVDDELPAVEAAPPLPEDNRACRVQP